jgi:hypothetical protein
VPSFVDYIKEWKLSLWETCFFREFRSKDGIRCTKSFDQQVGGKEASKWVLFRYMLFSTILAFFLNGDYKLTKIIPFLAGISILGSFL